MVRTGETSFDEVARSYDEVRPKYPQKLVVDVLSLSKIPEDGRILEIGCGTGQATLPFAEHGHHMLCLEPGKNLARTATENLRQYPNVEIERISFEEWKPQPKSFDLLISAQAFHWIRPEVGYTKAAEVLKDTGSIALIWNVYPDPDSEFFIALQDVYSKHAPQLAKSFAQREPYEIRIKNREEEINSTDLFEEVNVKRYPCSMQYTSSQYIKLLDTFSDHCMLDDTARHNLFVAVADLIETFGGTISRPHLAVLYFARKKRS
jgi:SAM-dependent methyltransferase